MGVLVDRHGKVMFVVLGSQHGIELPDFKRLRTSKKRFRGLRCIHTHLFGENLTQDDLTDLILLRLDMMSAVTLDKNGLPELVYSAYLKPPDGQNKFYWDFLPTLHPSRLDIDFQDFIKNLEMEFRRKVDKKFRGEKVEKGILIGVTTGSLSKEIESMDELESLAMTDGVQVVDRVIQRRRKLDNRYLLGIGKLKDLVVKSMYLGATMLIFNRELSPNQVRAICSKTDLKVIDRNQLILDIFARHASTEEGRLKVELAQLKYMLPRLVEKDDSLSRLTGGIGGRGPGETKLELDRRRIKKKITELEKKLKKVEENRNNRRKNRMGNNVFKISVVGYTNVGKSTLVRRLTGFNNMVIEDKLFATLNPFTKKMKGFWPVDVVVSDTVGFIEDLPDELLDTFKSTIEEIKFSDLIIHLVDISSRDFEKEINSVEKILSGILSKEIPRIFVFNKIDCVEDMDVEVVSRKYGGVKISAKSGENIKELINLIKVKVEDYVRTKSFKSG